MKKAIEYLEDFKAKQLRKKSRNTVEAYISDIMQFNEFVRKKGKDIDDITNEDVEAFKVYLLAAKNPATGQVIKPKTINRKLVSLRLFINYLNASVDYDNKIHVEIDLLKVQEQYYLDNLLTKQEYDRMVERAHQDGDFTAYAIFNTLYYTGVRVSEMLQIEAEHIIQDRLTVKGKGDKYREIILCETILSILRDYITRNNIEPHEKLFMMTRQNVHRLIKTYAGKCRIKLTHAHAHNFRHLCAFRLLDSGASIEDVADFLGHSNINTTRIYIRKTKKQLRDTLDKI